MKKMDYSIGFQAGRPGPTWTATALTDRAKVRTPELVTFEDRQAALKFLKDSQSEGYRFAGASSIDPEQRMVKNRYFAISSNGELIFSGEDNGPRDTVWEAHFVTSDRPVIRSFSDGPSSGRGLNDLRAELRFPLSKTSILEMKHRQWVVDAARKKTFKGRRKPKNADWTIGMEAADDAFIDSFNRQMAKQAHLLVFSGSVQEWLMEWMKEPIKPDKRVVSVLDTEEHLSVLGDNEPRLTRKRAWVVSSE